MEFLIEFKDQFLAFIAVITPIATIAFMSLGFISIIGRLWELVITDRSKNIAASFSIAILSIAYSTIKGPGFNLDPNYIWNVLELTFFSSIFYIAVCWRFYSRIDTLFDKKIGEDNFEPTPPKKKKPIHKK